MKIEWVIEAYRGGDLEAYHVTYHRESDDLEADSLVLGVQIRSLMHSADQITVTRQIIVPERISTP